MKQMGGPTEDELLEAIRGARRHNNDFWMDLVGLAIRWAPPDELAGVMAQIETHDREITHRWQQLRERLLPSTAVSQPYLAVSKPSTPLEAKNSSPSKRPWLARYRAFLAGSNRRSLCPGP